jgi:hypothetical protein
MIEAYDRDEANLWTRVDILAREDGERVRQQFFPDEPVGNMRTEEEYEQLSEEEWEQQEKETEEFERVWQAWRATIGDADYVERERRYANERSETHVERARSFNRYYIRHLHKLQRGYGTPETDAD